MHGVEKLTSVQHERDLAAGDGWSAVQPDGTDGYSHGRQGGGGGLSRPRPLASRELKTKCMDQQARKLLVLNNEG